MITAEDILLRGFGDREREDFFTMGRERQYACGETIIGSGASNPKLILVLEGNGDIIRRDERVGAVRSGDVIGAAVIFPSDQCSRDVAVKAASPVRVVEFSRNELFTFFKWKEERLFKIFVLNIMGILLAKLDRAEERIAMLEERLRVQVMESLGSESK